MSSSASATAPVRVSSQTTSPTGYSTNSSGQIIEPLYTIMDEPQIDSIPEPTALDVKLHRRRVGKVLADKQNWTPQLEDVVRRSTMRIEREVEKKDAKLEAFRKLSDDEQYKAFRTKRAPLQINPRIQAWENDNMQRAIMEHTSKTHVQSRPLVSRKQQEAMDRKLEKLHQKKLEAALFDVEDEEERQRIKAMGGVRPGQRVTKHEVKQSIVAEKKVYEKKIKERKDFLDNDVTRQNYPELAHKEQIRAKQLELWSRYTPDQNEERRKQRMYTVLQMIRYRADQWFEMAGCISAEGVLKPQRRGEPEQRHPPNVTRFYIEVTVPGESTWHHLYVWNHIKIRAFALPDLEQIIQTSLISGKKIGSGNIRFFKDIELELQSYDPKTEAIVVVQMQNDPCRSNELADHAVRFMTMRVNPIVAEQPEKIALIGPLKQCQPRCHSDQCGPLSYIMVKPELVRHCVACKFTFCSESCKTSHVVKHHPDSGPAKKLAKTKQRKAELKEKHRRFLDENIGFWDVAEVKRVTQAKEEEKYWKEQKDRDKEVAAARRALFNIKCDSRLVKLHNTRQERTSLMEKLRHDHINHPTFSGIESLFQ